MLNISVTIFAEKRTEVRLSCYMDCMLVKKSQEKIATSPTFLCEY
jgi:hypothetical protein